METLQPKLRFIEFDGVWNKFQIKDIGNVITGNTPPTANDNFYNGNYLFVSPFDISTGRWVKNTKTTLTKEGFEKGRKIRKGSTMFVCIGSTIGKIAQNNIDCITNQQINSVVPIDNDDNFIYSLLEYHSPKIRLLAAEQAVPLINKTTFSEYELLMPSLEEQTKIANFLTSLDEKLNLLKEKKTLLEEYKKGIMQKIFNQEIRFKDDNGNDFEDWEEKTIGEVCKLQGGYAFKSNLFKTSGIPIIRISNISNNNNHIELNNIVFYDKIENDNNFLVKNGDLLIAMSGATTGKSSVYNLNYNSYLNQRVGLFKSKIKELYYPYLIQFVFSIEFEKQLDSVLVAGAQPNISSSSIENFNLPLPCLKEQTKIANLLSAIDEKIELVSNQIQDTQEYKKGLLQQMFI